MSKGQRPPDRDASCTGKRRFSSYAEADRTHGLRRRWGRYKTLYRCRYCHGWHSANARDR